MKPLRAGKRSCDGTLRRQVNLNSGKREPDAADVSIDGGCVCLFHLDLAVSSSPQDSETESFSGITLPEKYLVTNKTKWYNMVMK